MTVASVVLVAAGAVAETAIAAPVPYEALSPEYVAIGDSYASGVGTRTYYSDASGCQRSPRAYPVIASVRVGATLVFEACVGADTADVLADQLDPLDAEDFINATLPGRLDTVYQQVRSRAPNARVVVVGYPRLFMGEDCNAGTWFSPGE
ncbi:MAG: hypothetical protein WKF64_09110, partial [Ilumatobacteraceae bacterium]